MNLAVEVSRRCGQRHKRLAGRPVMQLNSALGRAGPRPYTQSAEPQAVLATFSELIRSEAPLSLGDMPFLSRSPGEAAVLRLTPVVVPS